MSGTSRDLASRDLWEASLERSRARRHRAPVLLSSPPPAAPKRLPRPPGAGDRPLGARPRAGRDLSNPEHWELSSGRSHTRRRAAEIQFVPGSTRARRLSMGALAALTAGPAAALSEASAASQTATSADAPTTTEHAVTISPGAGGRHVRALQRALGLHPDGVFGPRTSAAVHHFQARHGLRRDGVVGARTAAALRGSPPAAAASGSPSAELSTAHAHHAQATVSRRNGAVRAHLSADAGGAVYERSRNAVVSGGSAPPVTGPSVGDGERRLTTAAPRVTPPAPSPTADAPAATQPAPAARDPHATPVTVHVSETGGTAMQQGAPTRQDSTGAGADSPSSSSRVAAVVSAGNRIARLPYRYGGGHGSFTDNAYDCSGSVSYALHGAGLISTPEASTALESYGSPGPGKRITVYANSGHAWMTVDGRRFDTAAMGQSGGSRWSSAPRSTAGYVVRHPTGY